MECTQVLDDINFGDTRCYKEGEKKELGYLEIAGVKHALYNGENLIGRDASCCSISFSSKALSKEHAVIEIIDEDNHLIYDLGSRNKTRLGKMVLQPHVRYQLPDGAKLHLADVSALYQRLSDNVEGDSDSGSETGSESMLTVNNSVVEDTVIVPETPAVPCAKQKSVVTVAESPCSSSDMDSSFGFTNTSKSDALRNDNIEGVLVGRAKASKNHAEVKQATDDDSIYEAETQCDIDCFDVNKRSADKLHVDSVSREGKICESAPYEEEDIFEAETQCEEPSLTVPVKSFGASDPKKQDLALRQCTDIPNKEIKVDVVSKAKIAPKSMNSIEQENVKICGVNRQHRTDHLAAKHVDNSCSKHSDELNNASAQCFPGEGDETSSLDKTDGVSVSSERTEEYVYDDASLSSHEDADNKNSVQGKADNKDLDIITQRKAVCSESQMAQVSLSNKGGQQIEQPARVRERKSSADTKILLNVSCNEDILDRSMLEGDDDYFAFQVTQISDSKEGAFETNKTTEKFNEVHQENKSKSNITNCDDPQTDLISLSKQCAVKQFKSEKMNSASKVSEKCMSDKSESYQAQNGSVNASDMFQIKSKNSVKSSIASDKETSKLSNESGDKMDADGTVEAATENHEQMHDNKKDLKLSVQLLHDSGDERDSEAKSQIILPPVSSSKTISKLSEPSSKKDSSGTSISINSENIKTKTQSPTHPGNAATQDRNIENQNEVMECENENNRELAEAQDSSKQDVSLTVSDKPAVVSSEQEKIQTQLSIESKDDDNSDDDDDVFIAPTQILFPENKNSCFTNPPASSKKKTADIKAISSSNNVEVPAQLNSAFEELDRGDGDSIFEAATQIVKSPNKGSKDFTKCLTLSPVEEKPNADHDDDIYEAATQIVGTPNNNNKDFTKPLASSPVEDKTDAERGNDDFIFEAETQIMETPKGSNKDFTETFAPSPVNEKLNADHDVDDNIYEAATQIVETPNKSRKDFTEPFTPSPVDEKLNADHDVDDNIYEAATQIVETPNKSKDFAEPCAPSPIQDRADAELDDSDSIFEAATQTVETPIRNSKDFTETSEHSSASDTADVQAITDDREVKKLRSPSGNVDEDNFECPIDSCDDADMANICSGSAQKVNLPENRITDLQDRDTSASRGSCSVMPKAERKCVNKSEVVELNKNFPMQDSKNSALITPKLHFDEIARTKRDTATSDDGETSKLKQSKASGDKIMSVEKDADENHRIVGSEVQETSNTNEGRKPELSESERQKLSCRDDQGETITTESKKLYGALTYVQRDDDKSIMAKSLKADDSTVCAQKWDTKRAEEAHGTMMRPQRNGAGKHGMGESKKPDVPTVEFQKGNDAVHGMTESECKAESVAITHRDIDGLSGMKESEMPDDNGACGQRYFSGEPVISDSKKESKKPSNILNAQKACDQEPEVVGSEILGDPHLSHDDSGDETDPEHVFETGSRKIKMEINSNKLSAVQISALPISSEETAHKARKSEVICIEDKHPSPASLILPQDTVASFGSGTKDKKGLTQAAESVDTTIPIQLARMSTKHISADSSYSKETSIVSLTADSDNSNGLLIAPTTKCNTAADEKIDGAIVKESSDQSVGESCVSEISSSFITSAVAVPLSQDQSTENREQSLNSELQAGTPSDHMKDTDQAQKTPLVSIRTKPDSEDLELEDSDIQKESDSKSHPDINQQTLLENERSVFEEGDRIVDEPVKDSLNDTQDLIMPLTQDLLKAVEESEKQESPFKPEECIPSEEEEPDTTPKVGRHSHLPNRRAKVRKRLNIDSRRSHTAVGASRRRRLPVEDSVQNDKSNITVRASKQRKLSDKNSVQNGSKNKAAELPSQSRADGSGGEFQQNESEAIVSTDDVNISKGRKSRIIAAKSKGQGKTVSSSDLQKDVNVKVMLEGSRIERSSRTKVERKEQNLSSEQCDEPRGRRSSKKVAKSTKDNDHKEARKSRRERSVNKNENGENSFATSSRPSRQRKMTWKIRDSLIADCSEGSVTPEEQPKNRSRGSSSSNSQNEINESLRLGTDMTVRSRSASSSKSPSKKLLKNSEDSKEVKDAKGTNSVSCQQNVSLRKSTRLSKGDNAVTSVTDPSKIESPQRTTRQNDRKDIRNNVQKRKNEEIFTELSSKRSKIENKVFPVRKSQSNSTDKCSPKTSKSVLNTDESFEGISEFNTRSSGRKGTQTATVGLMQEQSAFVTSSSTVVTENKKGSVQGSTRRWVRNRMEVTDTIPSCLKDLNILESLNASSRTQRGIKRTKPSAEEDCEHSPPKQAKSEKKLCEPCSSQSESSTQNVRVESRTSRTRRKVTSPQKLETREMTKQEAKPGQRERTSNIPKAEETDKSVTPRSRKTNLSENQDTTPKLTRSSRGKGTPQINSQLNSQKNGTNSGVSTPRRSSQRKVAGGTTYQVLFTGFSDTKQESIVKQLGGSVVDLPESCTVLVTDKVRRTYKFLCIMGQGKPIVSPEWLVQCQRSGCFLDPWQFLIKDRESESKFKFQLQESLQAASRTDLLAGYSVYVTPKVKPSPSEMKGIIESCGGVFMTQAPSKSWPVNSFIISCLDNKSIWCKLKKAGKPIVGPEVLLLGVLQQKLDLKSNTLV